MKRQYIKNYSQFLLFAILWEILYQYFYYSVHNVILQKVLYVFTGVLRFFSFGIPEIFLLGTDFKRDIRYEIVTTLLMISFAMFIKVVIEKLMSWKSETKRNSSISKYSIVFVLLLIIALLVFRNWMYGFVLFSNIAGWIALILLFFGLDLFFKNIKVKFEVTPYVLLLENSKKIYKWIKYILLFNSINLGVLILLSIISKDVYSGLFTSYNPHYVLAFPINMFYLFSLPLSSTVRGFYWLLINPLGMDIHYSNIIVYILSFIFISVMVYLAGEIREFQKNGVFNKRNKEVLINFLFYIQYSIGLVYVLQNGVLFLSNPGRNLDELINVFLVVIAMALFGMVLNSSNSHFIKTINKVWIAIITVVMLLLVYSNNVLFIETDRVSKFATISMNNLKARLENESNATVGRLRSEIQDLENELDAYENGDIEEGSYNVVIEKNNYSGDDDIHITTINSDDYGVRAKYFKGNKLFIEKYTKFDEYNNPIESAVELIDLNTGKMSIVFSSKDVNWKDKGQIKFVTSMEIVGNKLYFILGNDLSEGALIEYNITTKKKKVVKKLDQVYGINIWANQIMLVGGYGDGCGGWENFYVFNPTNYTVNKIVETRIGCAIDKNHDVAFVNMKDDGTMILSHAVMESDYITNTYKDLYLRYKDGTIKELISKDNMPKSINEVHYLYNENAVILESNNNTKIYKYSISNGELSQVKGYSDSISNYFRYIRRDENLYGQTLDEILDDELGYSFYVHQEDQY